MKCHLYLRPTDGQALRRGPIEVRDEGQARALAQAELRRDPGLQSVDIWWDHGELYRVQRDAGPLQGRAGAAWTKAFGHRPGRPHA